MYVEASTVQDRAQIGCLSSVSTPVTLTASPSSGDHRCSASQTGVTGQGAPALSVLEIILPLISTHTSLTLSRAPARGPGRLHSEVPLAVTHLALLFCLLFFGAYPAHVFHVSPERFHHWLEAHVNKRRGGRYKSPQLCPRDVCGQAGGRGAGLTHVHIQLEGS